MPPVRTLTPSVAPVAPVTKETKGGALALPSWAVATTPTVPQELPSGSSGVYVGQLQSLNTGNRATLLQHGVKDGDYYLGITGSFIPLTPFRFWMLAATAFRTKMDPSGNIIAASADVMQRSKDLDEHMVAVVAVLTGDEVTPAKVEFRRAQFAAGVAGVDALKLAQHPDFPQLSDAHKVAAQFPAPFGRMLVTVNVDKKISHTSGKPYYASSGNAAPPTVSQMEALLAACNDPGFTAKLDEVKAAYDKRCAQLAALCK